MCKKTIALCFVALLASGHLVAGGLERESGPTLQVPGAKPDVSSVEVSLVTVGPTEIRLTRSDSQESPSATVMVQLYHQALASEQTVVLQVGTAKTNPAPGVSVTYNPPNQIVRLPASDAGVVMTSVKISKPQLGSNPQGTVVITATLSNPSQGIRIDNDNPGAPNHQATLTIRNN